LITAVGIIPVRYDSRRFPGKPLALILGKPMIQWVWERAVQAQSLTQVMVATDDQRIFETAKAFGARAVLTSSHHQSGTERVAEAAETLDASIIVNIQGDEPLLQPGDIDILVDAFRDESLSMATLAVRRIEKSVHQDPDVVKVVTDREGFALYFSRAPLPFEAPDYFLQHIGIYGYRKDFLQQFCRLSPSRLESRERLEQLRALENGYRIKVLETSYLSLSVDNPEDIIKVEKHLKSRER
jgi:3-deoxy-manno-octulosonate cytidylyltransferase (CMP-KDO synthetase)